MLCVSALLFFPKLLAVFTIEKTRKKTKMTMEIREPEMASSGTDPLLYR
jgi:hypothetical protein